MALGLEISIKTIEVIEMFQRCETFAYESGMVVSLIWEDPGAHMVRYVRKSSGLRNAWKYGIYLNRAWVSVYP